VVQLVALMTFSWQPRDRFAGSEADDLADATNWSPYPTLHS
jgi:hypothetical protein